MLLIYNDTCHFDPFASVIPSEARNLSIYAQGRLREKSLTICFCSKISRRFTSRNDPAMAGVNDVVELKTKRKDRLKWVTILMQMKYLKWPSRLKEMVPDNFGKSKIDAIIPRRKR